MKGWLVAGCLLSAVPAWPLDASLWRGLDVRQEALPRGTRFNGVELQAIRFTGSGVVELEQRWLRRQPARDVRRIEAGGWRIHSRLLSTHSEVLQLRAGEAGEAIWSRIPLLGDAPTPQRLLRTVPSTCVPGPIVESAQAGRRMRQQTSLCRGTAARVVKQMQQAVSGAAAIRRRAHGFEAAFPESAQVLQVEAVALDARRTALLLVEHPAETGSSQ